MSFFTTLKHRLTGDWARVTLECAGGARGEKIKAVIRAAVAREPIAVERVYLKVRAFEEVEIPHYEFQNLDSQQLNFVDIKHSFDNYIQDYTVAGPQQLDANREYRWEYEFIVPEDRQPSFNGRLARHLWEVYAGLEMPGRDPESCWQVINIA